MPVPSPLAIAALIVAATAPATVPIETFLQPTELTAGTFGACDLLTLEAAGEPQLRAAGAGYLQAWSPAKSDAWIIRTKAPLPATYTVRVEVGFIDVDLPRPADEENGVLLLGITDRPVAPTTNARWHRHRKIMIDVDNNTWGIGGRRPIFFGHQRAAGGGNSFFSRVDGAFQQEWTNAANYERGAWYAVELEKSASDYAYRLYDGQGELLVDATVPRGAVAGAGHPDYLAIGDPYINYFSGRLRVGRISISGTECDGDRSVNACANGADDDDDGRIDRDDPGCTFANDNDEADPPPLEPVTVHTESGFETAGVIVTIPADGASGNEEARLEYRAEGETEYRPALPFSRYDRSNLATNLFYLTPETRYELRIEVTDPGRPAVRQVITDSVTTRSPRPPSRPTRVVTVSPGDSLQAAIADANPGDELRVESGTYGPVELTGVRGTAAAPIVIRAADPHRRPVIDGQRSKRALLLREAAWLVIDGFEIINAGSPADRESLGVLLDTCAHVVVRNCHIHDNGGWNVLCNRCFQFPGVPGGGNVFESNVIDGGARKGLQVDNNTLLEGNVPGTGMIIRDNVITGHDRTKHSDNAMLCGDETDVREGAVTTETEHVLALTGGGVWTNVGLDFYDNVLGGAGDDNLEVDGICVNARVFRNRLGDSRNNSISVSPAMPGPIIFTRNVVAGTWGESAVKFNTNGPDDVAIRGVQFLNNTFVQTGRGRLNTLLTLWYAHPQHRMPVSDRVVFRNNIFHSAVGGRLIDARNRADDPAENPSFDHNLWSGGRGARAFSWRNGETFASFDAWRQRSGQEENGLFADPALDERYAPGAKSPALARGVVIPGLTPVFDGAAPDIGAFERTAQ